MPRKAKEDRAAAKHTHSVWNGKAYDNPQTADQLAAESMAVLMKNPAIARLLKRK